MTHIIYPTPQEASSLAADERHLFVRFFVSSSFESNLHADGAEEFPQH